MFDMHWRKNADLRDNLKNIFSKDFTIHKTSGAKGFFEIESDPLRYRQLKKVILEKVNSPTVDINTIHESLMYCRLNMELRQLEERPISDEMFHKAEYALDKIEKAHPELKQVRTVLATEYWDEAVLASPGSYRNLLSPRM